MVEPNIRVKYLGTALPANADTESLFDSTLNGIDHWINAGGVKRFIYAIDHDQDATVNGYWSTDGGTTWVLFYTQAVAAASTPNSDDVFIEPYEDVKFEWVNGGVTQTTFNPNLYLGTDRSPSV